MMRNLRSAFGFLVFCAVLSTGCATTTLTSTWKDSSYQRQPRKIMVIGISKKPLNKRLFEDEFVRQLKARGTNAVASYTVVPDGKQSDREILAATMKEQGADAVLISRLVSKKTVHIFIPGAIISDYPNYYGTWAEYYKYGLEDMDSPGYMAEERFALMEANLYDAGDNKLIWSASSETEVQGSNQSQINSFIGAMVNAMTHQKLLR